MMRKNSYRGIFVRDTEDVDKAVLSDGFRNGVLP
jgi:hypothetical protein